MPKLRLAATTTSLLAIALLPACSTHMQTTSGSDYLSRYDESHTADYSPTTGVDADVRRIAAIEPDLRFPARIGLARIDNGQLVTLPGDEGYIWQDLASELGEGYGEFVPVSPLIAATVSDAKYSRDPGDTIAHIRRGAARQHLDYVMIYEVGASRQEKANALALADLTIIGMFVLPTRSLEVEASASAIMLDVRTGYPYATLTAHAEKSGVTRVVSGRSSTQALVDTAEERAVAKLAGEVEIAMQGLATRSLELAARPKPEPIALPARASTPGPAQSPMQQALAGE